uniref:GSVIVT00028307001, CUL4 n=1 Tax=Arundo donax TaxID=35708 RepID=A0A0A9DQC1_ARUDO
MRNFELEIKGLQKKSWRAYSIKFWSCFGLYRVKMYLRHSTRRI